VNRKPERLMRTYRHPIRLACPGARLVPLAGPGRGTPEPVPLSKPLTLVGSGSGVHVCLQTRSVEEFHACLLNCDAQVYVRDLGTLGGVSVNGQRVRDCTLRDGDVLQLGKVQFRFEPGVAPGAPARRAPSASADPAPPARLAASASTHPLGDRVILIGRGPRADVRVHDDDEVTEKHALVFLADGHWRRTGRAESG
jgi:hypothetical protein